MIMAKKELSLTFLFGLHRIIRYAAGPLFDHDWLHAAPLCILCGKMIDPQCLCLHNYTLRDCSRGLL